jgi:hypothetical protein
MVVPILRLPDQTDQIAARIEDGIDPQRIRPGADHRRHHRRGKFTVQNRGSMRVTTPPPAHCAQTPANSPYISVTRPCLP